MAGTGYRGTFVISWSQTEVDGVQNPDPETLGPGAAWRWTGDARCIDGPEGVLLLSEAMGMADLRRRAARTVRALVGGAASSGAMQGMEDGAEGRDRAPFDVTDGLRRFELFPVETGEGRPPLLVCEGGMPPPDTDLWVLRASRRMRAAQVAEVEEGAGFLCFTPGTRIRTEEGSAAVEDLRPGDRVLTRDDGPQPVIWAAARRISGARLRAMPALRPVRLRPGALGIDLPDADLILSPGHRVLVQGPAATALFGVPEVLVAAIDLLNDRTVLRDHALRETAYVHLLFDRHQVVTANGVACESFHPAEADLSALDPAQREGLAAARPDLLAAPGRYGGHARRALSLPEAAILLSDPGGLRRAS